MFKLRKYQFESFKYRPGLRANYGILTEPGNNEWGMKYSPTYSYDREYEVLKNYSHPQIPKRYESGTGRGELYENEKLVLNEITLGLLEEDPSNRIPSAEKLRDELASVV